MILRKYIDDLKINPLFIGIDDLDKMLDCLSAKVDAFKQDDIVLLSGNAVKYIGIVLSGSVRVIKEHIDGNINILTELKKGDTFAEAFLCAGISVSPVTVQSVTNSEILFIDFMKVNNACTTPCSSHMRLIQNMLSLIAKKSIMLNRKIEIMAGRTIREKLLLFFATQKGMANNTKFTIPYNREELAHYLCVDRSAMSRELCKMRDEGLIRFSKNMFELI